MLVIKPERRFSIDAEVNHLWTAKNTSPLTKLIIDQILDIKDKPASPVGSLIFRIWFTMSRKSTLEFLVVQR